MRLATLAASALAVALSAAPVLAGNFVTKPSPYGVAETVERLTNAIAEGGAKVIATVDHAAAAGDAGMELRPTTLLIFGNPKMGTPLMQQTPSIALDLPLRVAVYEGTGGETQLAYPDLAQVALEHGLPEGTEAVENAVRALEALTDKAVAAP